MTTKDQTKKNALVTLWGKATANIYKTIALVVAMGTASGAMVEFYTTYQDASNIPEYKAELRQELDSLKAQLELERTRNNISIDLVRCELDHNKYFPDVEHTNGGDAWYFTKKMINGKEYNVVFSADYKKKSKRYGYIDFENKHHWIENE